MAILTNNYTAKPPYLVYAGQVKTRETEWNSPIDCGWSEPYVLRCLFQEEGVVLWENFLILSLPPSSHVTQLKTVGGRRWIAHCPPTLWSFFWMASLDPDDKPGGKRLPAAASGSLADGQALGFPVWAPSRCFLCFSYL